MFQIILGKVFFQNKISVPLLMDGLVNIDNFFDNSVISWRIILIFEFDRD